MKCGKGRIGLIEFGLCFHGWDVISSKRDMIQEQGAELLLRKREMQQKEQPEDKEKKSKWGLWQGSFKVIMSAAAKHSYCRALLLLFHIQLLSPEGSEKEYLLPDPILWPRHHGYIGLREVDIFRDALHICHCQLETVTFAYRKTSHQVPENSRTSSLCSSSAQRTVMLLSHKARRCNLGVFLCPDTVVFKQTWYFSCLIKLYLFEKYFLTISNARCVFLCFTY